MSMCQLFLLAVLMLLLKTTTVIADVVKQVNSSLVENYIDNSHRAQLLQLLSQIIPSIELSDCQLSKVLKVSTVRVNNSVKLHFTISHRTNRICSFVRATGNGTNDASVNESDGDFVFTENSNDEVVHRGLPISIKQTIVFAVCGAIICGFFLVAAIMRFRNRLRKTLRKRRLLEKEAKREKLYDQKPTNRTSDPLDPLTELYECASQKDLSLHDVMSLNHCSPSLSLASLGAVQEAYSTPLPLTPNSFGQSFSAQFESVDESSSKSDKSCRSPNRTGKTATLASPEHDIIVDDSSLPNVSQQQQSVNSTLPKFTTGDTSALQLLAPPGRKSNRQLCKSLSYQSGVTYKFPKLTASQLANSLPAPAISSSGKLINNNVASLLAAKPSKLTPSQRQQLLVVRKKLLEDAQVHERHFRGRTVYNVDLHHLKRVPTVSGGELKSQNLLLSRNTGNPRLQRSVTTAGTLPAKYSNYSSYKRRKANRRRDGLENGDSTSGVVMLPDEDGNNSDLDM